MTLDLDVITDNLYLNALKCTTVILLFVCDISNRILTSSFILYLMRFVISFNKQM